MAEVSSYVIVGGGVFGASTAYHLSRKHPKASITLIDRSPTFPCPLAASHDFNKIIRADYGSIFYMELALKAKRVWETDPLFKPFYHQSGLLNLDDTGLGRKMIKNYETLHIPSEAVIFGPEDMKTRYNGVFADADYRGVEELYLNPTSGWAEATRALTKVIETSVENRVKYVEGDVDLLRFNHDGECIGVLMKGGRIVQADKIILSTGAGTAKLLLESAPKRTDLHAGDRIKAAAVVTGIVKLNNEQAERLQGIPSFIHSVGVVQGIGPNRV